MEEQTAVKNQMTFDEYADGLPAAIQTDGDTYEPDRDATRLQGQRKAIFALMSDGLWRTLPLIASITGHPEASVSARLRDFRKAKYGSNTVERRYVGDGLWAYRLIPSRTEWAE
jgi:hypothetical protein